MSPQCEKIVTKESWILPPFFEPCSSWVDIIVCVVFRKNNSWGKNRCTPTPTPETCIIYVIVDRFYPSVLIACFLDICNIIWEPNVGKNLPIRLFKSRFESGAPIRVSESLCLVCLGLVWLGFAWLGLVGVWLGLASF